MADHTPADIPAAGDWMTENDPLTVFSTIGLDTDSPVRSSGSFDQAVLIPGGIPRGSGRGAGAYCGISCNKPCCIQYQSVRCGLDADH